MTAARRTDDEANVALSAAALVALDPHRLGGVLLRGPPGPVRDMWMAHLAACLAPERPLVRIPASVSAGRLTGEVDVLATLAAGRPVVVEGLLAKADGGIVELRSAECVEPQAAAILSEALDTGTSTSGYSGSTGVSTRFGLIALDEGTEAEERLPAVLAERLGLWLDLSDLTSCPADDGLARRVGAARQRLAGVRVPDAVIASLAHTAAALGIASDRALILATRTARASAALAGRAVAGTEDAELAAMLVLAPRATRLPRQEAEAEDQHQDEGQPDEAPAAPSDQDKDIQADGGPMEDRVLDAAVAALPRHLLESLGGNDTVRRRGETGAGRRRQHEQEARRGRQTGSRAGDPRRGQRLDLIATLRTAVPWQAIRAGGAGLKFRASDLRVRRFRQQRGCTTIFCVDASGSAALERLGEAKGAVEQMLAGCYVRRDEVALIAFRGLGAEIVVPPTRSLRRARHCLAGLPGGGGTPLADGIATACRMARDTGLRGRTPTLVVITDGRPNIGFGGVAGRVQAGSDALSAAREVGLHRFRSLLIDNSTRSEPQALALATAMGARYLALPHADAASLHAAVRDGAAAVMGGFP
ncbi:magnesium chelatase subunit D [Phreatobacter sp.]|uniref:magnesium chelatase subunit D n=1 Tax=Phreatobacter sp. TaxID=1966341 RepID=UPI003F6E58DE